ncbi:unnamed protein product [Caenorhabditis sp. 36 PRJEB53466]|nr:unnamed protein product [Caenorhabditis sp. 36 PRJEB53466]
MIRIIPMSIGIDLGTTFCCVAHYQNGQVNVLENENGCRTTPSVLAIGEDDEWLVGQHAKDVVTKPSDAFFDVKRMIGRRYDDILIQRDMILWPFCVEKEDGGTFDVAVVNIDGPRITVKSKGEFKKRYQVDLHGNYKALKRLRKAAEAAKITLSASTVARIELECLHGGVDFIMKITRSELDRWVENLLLSTTIHVEQEAVAYGAAVMAAVLTGVDDVQDMRLNDMIPMSIGVQCNRDYMSVLIKKGTVFPCSKKKTFINSEDFQTHINVPVFEGGRARCSDNRLLGEITLPIRASRRGESVIDITLEVDHNGILQATAFDTVTQKVVKTTIVYDHCTFTMNEIEKLTNGSEEDRQLDESFRQRYKQLQKSEDLAYDYKYRLEKVQGSIELDKFAHLMEAVEREISWLSAFPKVSFSIAIVRSQKAFHSRRIGTEGQIIGRILSEYDSNSRPPVREHAANSAILVITNIFISRLIWRTNHAEVDLYLRQQWQDSRLKYDVDTREGIEEIRLPMNRKIWEPDTYFTSGRELGRHDKNSKNIIIEPSGYVRASERILLELPYAYGTMFPFTNSRQFTIKLGSYNYDIDDIVYLWANSPPLVNPIEVSGELLKGDLTFEEANAGDCVGNYTVGVFSCIDAHVSFSAGTLSGLMSWFFPSLFLLIGSWLHFWIHGSWSVPRSISAAVPFFILAAYYIFMSEDAYTEAQGAWLGFCLILTFLSFIEYFLVIGCGGRRSIRYKTLGTQEEHPMGAAKETVEVAYNEGCASFRNNSGIDVIARILFPAVTVVFLVIYFIFIV